MQRNKPAVFNAVSDASPKYIGLGAPVSHKNVADMYLLLLGSLNHNLLQVSVLMVIKVIPQIYSMMLCSCVEDYFMTPVTSHTFKSFGCTLFTK